MKKEEINILVSSKIKENLNGDISAADIAEVLNAIVNGNDIVTFRDDKVISNSERMMLISGALQMFIIESAKPANNKLVVVKTNGPDFDLDFTITHCGCEISMNLPMEGQTFGEWLTSNIQAYTLKDTELTESPSNIKVTPCKSCSGKLNTTFLYPAIDMVPTSRELCQALSSFIEPYKNEDIRFFSIYGGGTYNLEGELTSGTFVIEMAYNPAEYFYVLANF